MLTRSFLILAGGALATLLALACPAPAAASQPGRGLTEIPDPELDLMRGRYTVGGNSVAWFGVTMISTWTDAAGRTLEGGMTLGMDFSDGGQVPVVSFTPVVSITDADAPLPVTGGGARSIDASGLANAAGLLQSVQVAGDGADDDLAQRAGGAGGQMGLEHLNALLHGLGGNEHFGDKDVAVFEVFAHHIHGGNHSIQQRVGIAALVQRFLHRSGNQLGLAANNQIIYVFDTHNRFSFFI